jgi:hypothetical protein
MSAPRLAAAIPAVPQVQAYAAPPIGRRRMWALVVPDCPWCRHLHLHRATGREGGLRVASCGRPYRLRVAGTRRARWAK